MAHITPRRNQRGDTVYLVQVYLGVGDNGKKRFLNRTIHGTKNDAKRFARDTEAKRDRGTLVTTRHTINELLDDVLIDYKVNRQRVDFAESVVKRLRPAFGRMDAARLNASHVSAFIADRQDQGAANGTIRLDITLLRRAFNLAHKSSKIAKVPWFPGLKVSNTRTGFFEADQYEALFSELAEEIRPVLAFAYYTGCRVGEILYLRWDQVDLERRTVRLNPGETKNKQGRLIPLIGPLAEILAMQKALRDQYWPQCPWVMFRHASGKRIRDFRSAWKGACRRAGLWDQDKGKHSRVFHDLRRTGARNLVRAGVPEKVVMAIGGWKTRSMFDRYNITSEADVLEAGRKLEQYLSQEPGCQTIVEHEPQPHVVQ